MPKQIIGIREKCIPQIKKPIKQSELSSMFFGVYDATSQRLDNLKGKPFAEEWLLHKLIVELLDNSIEDDYIDIASVYPEAAKNLQNLLAEESWVSPKVVDFLESCRNAAQQEVLTSKAAKIKIPPFNGGGSCIILGVISPKDQPLIPVSKQYAAFVPILEDSVADPVLVANITKSFVYLVTQLKKNEGANSLCFIEKAVGPVGALSMLSSLVSELNMPACIYRESHWSKRAKLAAYRPKKTDRVVIVYDLIVTGNGIRHVVRELKRTFDTTVVGAVVLMGYGPKTDSMEIDHGHTIKVKAVGWYDDFKEVVENGRTKTASSVATNKGGTTEIAVFTTDGDTSRFPVDVGETNDPHPSKRGERMMSSNYWSRSFGAYKSSELRAVTFTSKELDRAIPLICNDPEFRGMPWYSPDGRTLFVPQEVIPILKARGLKFKISKVVSAGDLPTKERVKIRKLYGISLVSG